MVMLVVVVVAARRARRATASASRIVRVGRMGEGRNEGGGVMVCRVWDDSLIVLVLIRDMSGSGVRSLKDERRY